MPVFVADLHGPFRFYHIFIIQVLCSWHFDVEVKDGPENHGGAPVAVLRTVPVLCGVRMSVQV